ncbi:MAG: 16S rRNA (guanine(527)-N(7))-methyltransferase RsmG [Geminicoccaceae bacterium]|nr:16S rRNA (guanine(527)-N(7))-methyltransferase RsmG [Geminicoccaceae bacterium]
MPAAPAEGAPPPPAEIVAALGVSRETLDRLRVYLDLLFRWNRAINLVGRSTLADPWRRHVLDSAQLHPLLPPAAGTLIDLGSGAGLPGLVLAVMESMAEVHLVESDGRKAQFLREAARATGCGHVRVHAERIEDLNLKAGAITARALAPLPRLLELAAPLMREGATCLFLKGRSLARELTEAGETWTMDADVRTSLVDPDGRILILKGIRRGAA